MANLFMNSDLNNPLEAAISRAHRAMDKVEAALDRLEQTNQRYFADLKKFAAHPSVAWLLARLPQKERAGLAALGLLG